MKSFGMTQEPFTRPPSPRGLEALIENYQNDLAIVATSSGNNLLHLLCLGIMNIPSLGASCFLAGFLLCLLFVVCVVSLGKIDDFCGVVESFGLK